MDYLINFGSKNKTVQQIMEAASEEPRVQGVVLELDPFWLQLWRIKETFGADVVDRLTDDISSDRFRWEKRNRSFYDNEDSDFRKGFYVFLDRFSKLSELFSQINHYWIPSKPLDENVIKQWKPSILDMYYETVWSMDHKPELPVILKICLYPPAYSQKLDKQLDNFYNLVQQISRYSEPLPIVYETRPPAVLCIGRRRQAEPVLGGVGIGVGQRSPGTLGGILKSLKSDESYYGLTCSHVIGNSRNCWEGITVNKLDRDQPSYSIGEVTHISRLITSTSLCNQYIRDCNEVDAALIQLDPSIQSELKVLQIGQLSGITPRAMLSVGQAVEFTGRTSGHRTLEIGGLGVCYKFQNEDREVFCFRNLIELKNPLPNIFPPIQGGDSGAWVCTPTGQGYEWCGMVVGQDRRVGYAIFSETIQEWWESRGLKLSVNS